MRTLPCFALASLTLACSRTGLLLPSPGATVLDAGAPDVGLAPACPTFPPIPAETPVPLGQACTFSPGAAATTPVLAAFVGGDLLGLTPQATLVPLFHFGVDVSQGVILEQSVVSRGDYLGALAVSSRDAMTLDVELVLLRTSGAVLVHHRETVVAQDYGGSYGVVGNAAGTFAFSVGMGAVGKVWLGLADGTLLGAVSDVTLPYGGLSSPLVDPDARGRVLVLPAKTNSTAAVSWLDVCAGTMTPSRLLAEGTGTGWSDRIFGVTRAGELATETADGVTLLSHPPLPAQAGFWDFVPPGIAMFAVPPYAASLSAKANLLVIDARALADHPVSLDYPGGLSVVPPDGWVSEIGDSNNPAGFGLDSQSHVTMFLRQGSPVRLATTTGGSDWTSLGPALAYDANVQASYSLAFAEAGGTYFIVGDAPAGGGPTWHVVRPASGVDVAVGGPGRIARDGGCVAALVGPRELDVVDAVTGTTTKVALPAAVTGNAWTSTWIPGDDAVLWVP